MRQYQIIDCTKPIGCERHVRGKRLAHFFAVLYTLKTGRFHDYVPATAFSRLLEGI